MKSLLFSSFLILLFSACESGPGITPSESNPEDPRNLEISILNYDDGSGIVAISASADNAVEYQFYLDDGSSSPVVKATGDYEHTYEDTGTYTIEVRAVGTNERFVKKEEKIFVDTGGPIMVEPGYISPLSYPGMELEWGDEFNGNTLNLDNWTFDNGDGCPNLCGWGNNELEYYRPDNLSIKDGIMTIEARKEAYEGKGYTSSKIVSREKKTFKYGRIDIRAKMPFGQGLWPALWMLGTNQSNVGWPNCGEIDIMEMVGGNGKERTTHGTAHWGVNGQQTSSGKGFTLETGNLSTEFNVYSLIWTESKMEWLFNDVPFHEINTTSGQFDAFQKPFYMIMNVAVGGNWPGNPNDSTQFPTSMEVDYVRHFKDK